MTARKTPTASDEPVELPVGAEPELPPPDVTATDLTAFSTPVEVALALEQLRPHLLMFGGTSENETERVLSAALYTIATGLEALARVNV